VPIVFNNFRNTSLQLIVIDNVTIELMLVIPYGISNLDGSTDSKEPIAVYYGIGRVPAVFFQASL